MIHNCYTAYKFIIIIYVGVVGRLYSFLQIIMKLVELIFCVSCTSQVKSKNNKKQTKLFNLNMVH